MWKPKSKWTINMCDFVNKSGSNVTYQRALERSGTHLMHPDQNLSAQKVESLSVGYSAMLRAPD